MVFVVVTTIAALSWMAYRVYALIQKPIPILVKLLGLELPCPPRVSLHGISADTITLHWSLPEKAGSVAKHIIQINGINVGESEKRGETSVTVTGLNPDTRYNVRVIAANSNNFQAPGPLIRLRTRRKSRTSAGSQAAKVGDSSDDAPTIHTSVAEATPPAQPHAYNHHHHNHSRRTGRERRGSPATLEQQHQLQHQHNYRAGPGTGDDRHTVESLTKDLDAVRKEIQETEAQLAHTEEEYKAAEAVLKAELDTLKDKKNEEDVARQRLRTETKSLEEAKRTAEATKSRTERLLRLKEYDIKKMQDDMAKWDDERMAALEKVDDLARAAEESRENAATTEKEYSDDIKESQSSIAELEEKIRALVGTLKTLESHREQLKAREMEEENTAKEEIEKERQWTEKLHQLEMRYVTAYNSQTTAEAEFNRSREMLLTYQRRGSGSGETSAMPPQPKKPKQRRNRNRKSRNVSSPINSFPVQDPRIVNAAVFGNPQFQQSPTFTSSPMTSPFFNRANGTPLTGPPDLPGLITGPTLDADRLMGGAPMSPTANSLLPSNLFGYDEDVSPPGPKKTSQEDLKANSTPDFTSFVQQPQSPMSSGSVSTSPRSSFNHIQMFPSLSAEATRDSDHSSGISPIGSHRETSGNSNATEENSSGGRRFVKLFGTPFNRQRGKTLPNDAGPIGNLKPSESQSFPKKEPPGLDPIGTRRRSGSYGSWPAIPDFLHTSRGKNPLDRTSSNSSRRSAINQFQPNFDPIDPQRLFENSSPVSPRPGSIASFENMLPAPHEVDGAAFGWPVPREQPRNTTGLPSLADWGMFGTSRMTQSRPASRPISPINHSTASLSLLPSQIAPPPGLALPSASSTRPVTPRLNPAAPTFQSRQTPARQTQPPSQPNSASRDDALSIHSTASTAVSGTASMDSATATNSKDSMLSRLSGLARKSSTGKFTGFFRKKGDEDAAGSGADDDMAASPGKPTGLWSGWRKDGNDSTAEEADEDAAEDSVTPATTPLVKESSPWIKGGKDGFFGTIGRKKTEGATGKKDDAASQGDDGWESDTSVIVGGGKDREKKREGLGIFRRRRNGGEANAAGSADEN